MMKTAILIMSVVLFSFQMADAQDQQSDPIWSPSGLETSAYKAVPLLISGKGFDEIKLTEESIRGKCELRLKQANLDPIPATTPFMKYLEISVSIVGTAFLIEVEFNRSVTFKTKSQEYQTEASTWKRVVVGTHGQDPEFVMQRLDRQLNYFLDDYLKANAK
jgi:hypothetical protein